MPDPAARYNKTIDEERERLRGLVKDYQSQIPAYSPQAQELTRDEERQDYQMAKGTPGDFAVRLKQGKEKFGLVRAVDDILDWSIRNEHG